MAKSFIESLTVETLRSKIDKCNELIDIFTMHYDYLNSVATDEGRALLKPVLDDLIECAEEAALYKVALERMLVVKLNIN